METELSESDYVIDKSAFNAFTDHIFEELILKCFWNQLKPEQFLKLCDLAIILGNEFIIRLSFHYLKNFEIKLNNGIKRAAKGLKITPSSLVFISNTVLKEILHTVIPSGKFKTYALDIISYRDDQVKLQ